MKVVAYNIKEFEKELLAKANGKVHDLILISNALNMDTLHYCHGKEAVIISDQDVLDKNLLLALNDIGVRQIITRSSKVDHIDLHFAGELQLHVANTPLLNPSPEDIARQTISSLTAWGTGGCVGNACHCSFDCVKKGK